MRAFNSQLIEQYRANGGAGGIGPVHFDRIALLTTTGRRSELPRTTPLGVARDGETLIVYASNNGAPRDPDWFANLVAEPLVRVELGGERFAATARVLDGAERERAYQVWLAAFPTTAGHRDRAGRIIPIIALQRTEEQ
jgi:deazaflavin-dependent oxidoreductase (nitroreductase family)